MRCLGQIEGRKSAEKFVAHLLTLDISTQIESMNGAADATADVSNLPRAGHTGPDAWEIWVRDEDQLELAQRELHQFESNSSDPKYDAAISKATQILDQREQARQQAAKNVRRLDTTLRSGLSRGPMRPLTITLLVLSIGVGLITNFADPGPNNAWGISTLEELSFVSSTDYSASGGDPAASLKRGQVWRAITPVFIHIGIFHLAINMFMLVSLGRLTENWMGTPRFALMVLVLAVFPNLFQGLAPEWMHGTPSFGGMSGVLYGLLGYIWIRTTINPTHGISIPFPMIVLAIGFIVVGLSGLVPGWRFADLCHLGGLLVGSAFGFAAERAD